MSDLRVCEKEAWLTPDRRAELRAGALPTDSREADFQTSFFAHRADRAAADACRD